MTGRNLPLGFGTIKIVDINSSGSDSQGTIAPILRSCFTS